MGVVVLSTKTDSHSCLSAHQYCWRQVPPKEEGQWPLGHLQDTSGNTRAVKPRAAGKRAGPKEDLKALVKAEYKTMKTAGKALSPIKIV